MTTIHLDDATAALLSAKAAASGLSVEAFIKTSLLSELEPPPRMTLEEFERFLDEESESQVGGSPTGTFSREELYSDHD